MKGLGHWLSLLPVVMLLAFPGAARAQSDDAERLREMHAELLRAHREGDVDAWMALEAPEVVSVSDGRVTFPEREERRRARAAYLESTVFTAYRDTREPIVRVSDDGTLGWVLAQVEIRGTRVGSEGRNEPFQDLWAWVELYEKLDGEWRMVGNAANRRTEP